MIVVDEQCTGCMACYNSCPKSAITIGKDANGFIIPLIDKNKCVNCGACDNICPKRSGNGGLKPISAYYFKSMSSDVLHASSSGGAFHYLANIVLNKGGIVYGCIFDAKKRMFVFANTENTTLEDIQRSKYVEGSIGATYMDIKKQLETGRWVLFSGTPCQAAGLRSYLMKKYDTLIIVDFTCGGVPSQKFFFDYVERIERKKGSSVSNINFRDKYYKWGQYCISLNFENGSIYRKKAQADPYFYCFLHKNIKRMSCVKCNFANNHFSDIILADFWKYQSITNKTNDTTGISLILCQTEAGEELVSDLLKDASAECFSVDLESACYNIKEKSNTDNDIEDAMNAHAFITKYGIAKYYKKYIPFTTRAKWMIKQMVSKL